MNKIKNFILEEKEYVAGGFIAFFGSFIVYLKTMAPGVSFWDCGEFIACAKTLAVPHPPGSPFYILLGRIFTMLPISSDIAVRVNIISALSTSLTILLIYLIIVQLIRSFNGKPSNRLEKVILYGSSVIGALCFAFSDTLWFNAVEAEVYALSMFFTAVVLWLALKWYEARRESDSTKYLILIVYCFGLAFGVHLLNLLVIPSIGLLILFYQPKLLLRWKLWAMVPVVAFIGISTYFMIYIRSGMDPIINQNDPSNFDNFWYYFNREQYGSKSLFLTIFERVAPFWEYQVKKMYLRYFSWNFIGKGTTITENYGYIVENFSANGLKAMPFIVGIAGMIFHWMKDWRKALIILILFILAGVGIVIYLNQPDPQPRERDYVYMGSFFAFAIWMGIGTFFILDIVKKWLESGIFQKIGLVLVAIVLIIICPVNQLQVNYASHDRSGDYVPWDYAYNMLVTCEQDAILFTNGDNDTFPLWYLQEVENIRKDVKVVNLSLLNTSWYILQLKHYPPQLNVGFEDNDIARLGPQEWQEVEVQIPVTKEVLEKHFAEYGRPVPENLLADPNVKFNLKPTWSYGGKSAITVQDIMTIKILLTNQWRKPVYFAITVNPKFLLGMDNYLRLDGLNWKVTPVKFPEVNEKILRTNILDKFQYRGINDPSVHLDFGTIRLLNNYRNAFMRLSHYYFNQNRKADLIEILDTMEKHVPEFRHNFRDRVYTENIAKMYLSGGDKEKFRSSITRMLEWEPRIQKEKQIEYVNYLISLFQDYDTAEEVFTRLYNENPRDPAIIGNLVAVHEAKKQYTNAIDLLEGWIVNFPKDSNAIRKLTALKDSLNRN